MEEIFGLIEWNFGEADEIAVRKSIDNLVEQLCVHFDVNKKYAEVITAKILDMISLGNLKKISCIVSCMYQRLKFYF